MSRSDALKLRTMIGGAWLTQAIAMAAKFKLADLLQDGPQTSDELAKSCGTQPDLLFRVMRALASQGIFRETDPGVFQNTGLSNLLRSDADNSLRNVAIFFGDQTYLAFEHFANQLKTGEIAYEKKYNRDFFSLIANDPERDDVFNRAMAEISYEQAGAILDAYDFSGINSLCDVAGGNGKILAAVLKKYPKMQGIVFEQSHVIDVAKDYIQRQGLTDRVQYISGDFFKPLEVKADACMMKYIIHDWPDDKAVKILKNCKKAFSKIIVIEQMIPAGNDPLYGKLSDLMMMTSFGAGERSETDFRTIFDKAGLKLEKIHPTDYLLYLFELGS